MRNDLSAGDPLAELAKLIETSQEGSVPWPFDHSHEPRYVTELLEPSLEEESGSAFLHDLIRHIPPVHPVTPLDAIAELPIFSTPAFIARRRQFAQGPQL